MKELCDHIARCLRMYACELEALSRLSVDDNLPFAGQSEADKAITIAILLEGKLRSIGMMIEANREKASKVADPKNPDRSAEES